MPYRLPSPCSVPRCPNTATSGSRCNQHARQDKRQKDKAYDEQRETASQRGYGARWRKLRTWYLSRHPLCVECGSKGRVVPATDIDHVIPRRKGGTDDEDNLRSMCTRHHSQKTNREDGGGWRPAASPQSKKPSRR